MPFAVGFNLYQAALYIYEAPSGALLVNSRSISSTNCPVNSLVCAMLNPFYRRSSYFKLNLEVTCIVEVVPALTRSNCIWLGVI
jgi:hypothetical protein